MRFAIALLCIVIKPVISILASMQIITINIGQLGQTNNSSPFKWIGTNKRTCTNWNVKLKVDLFSCKFSCTPPSVMCIVYTSIFSSFHSFHIEYRNHHELFEIVWTFVIHMNIMSRYSLESNYLSIAEDDRGYYVISLQKIN